MLYFPLENGQDQWCRGRGLRGREEKWERGGIAEKIDQIILCIYI